MAASTITLSLDNRAAISALQAYSRALSRELGDTDRQAGSATQKLFSFNQAWEAVERVAGKAAKAIGLAVGAINQVVRATGETDEKLGIFATTLSISVQEVAQLSAVAARFGLEQDKLQDGLKGLTTKISEAANGSAEAAALFDQLGIAVKRTDGSLKTSTEVMHEVATSFSQMENGSKKTGLAMKLFEESGRLLIPMLNEGSDGIRKMGRQFEEMGILATEASVKSGTEVSRNFRTIESMVTGVVQKLGRELMPAFADASAAAIQYGVDLIKGIDWPMVISAVGHLTEKFGLLTQAVVALSKPLFIVFDALQTGVSGAIALVFKLAQAFVEGMEPVLVQAEMVARAIGQDGIANDLADAQLSVRDFSKVMSEALDDSADQVAEFSTRLTRGGLQMIKVAEDAGAGMTNLGGKIIKASESSSKAVAGTSSAVASMGKTIETVGGQSVEVLRGAVEPAMQSAGSTMTQVAGSTEQAGAKMIEILDRGVQPAAQAAAGAFDQFGASVEKNVAVFRGAGREVARTLTQLGEVQFSLSQWQAQQAGTGGAMSFGAISGTANDRFRARQAGRRSAIDSFGGFGGVSDSIDIDPLTVAFAQSGGYATQGLTSDLLMGRANAITGERFNAFKAAAMDAPRLQADWEERTAAHQSARSSRMDRAGQLVSRATQMGMGGPVESARQTLEATNSIIAAQERAISVNKQVAASWNSIADAARKASAIGGSAQATNQTSRVLNKAKRDGVIT